MCDPAVKVTWFDSHMESVPWHHRDDVEPSMEVITTVGFLFKSSDDWITLYQSNGGECGIQGVFHIPRGCVVKVEPL